MYVFSPSSDSETDNTVTQPNADDNLGGATYLAYPPMSRFWSYSSVNESQSPSCELSYTGVFTWQDLLGCTDASNNTLLTVTNAADALTLAGTLYINVVSPYAMGSTDSGFYRLWALAQSDFSIVILKQINVLASTGVELFISSVCNTMGLSVTQCATLALRSSVSTRTWKTSRFRSG